jgi:hypothetical protein
MTVEASVNTAQYDGAMMKAWLEDAGALTGPGDTLPIRNFKQNVASVGASASSWIAATNPAAASQTAHQVVAFNAPVGASDSSACGRVVYTDLHVGSGDAVTPDKTNTPFPNGCTSTELTPQESALEFLLFDLPTTTCTTLTSVPTSAEPSSP